MNKLNLTIEKRNKALLTNDNWLVSDMFANPVFVAREINRIR